MRTTIEIPDALFRRTKATAAARGITLKQLIVAAVERDLQAAKPARSKEQRPRLKLPVIHLEPGKVMDLSDFNFDDLLS